MTTSLHIKILSVRPDNYSTSRLVEAGLIRGHDMQVDNILNYTLTEKGLLIVPPSESANAIIPRIGGPLRGYGTTVVQAYESNGTYTTASSHGLNMSKDKFKTSQILVANGLQVPRTVSFARETSINSAIDYVGGYPIIIKLLTGSQGKSVIFVDNPQTARSLIQTLLTKREPFLVQEFVKEANGSDLRCLVVNGKVIGAMIRTAQAGEFRSNIHQGGTAKKAKLSREERRAALKAAKAMKLNVAGVDILRSDTGPKILEVNSSPGLEGIEKATGKDIASEIIACIEANVSTILRAPV